MSATVVHQLVPSVVPGDATTAHTLQLQLLLRDLGYESEVFALAIHPRLEHRARLIDELRGPSRRDRFLVYQCSAVSELGDWLVGRREAVALDYHNITPPEFFRRFDPDIALSLHAGQVQVAQLSAHTALGICDSTFNATDARSRGVRATAVAPILLDVGEFDAQPDAATAAGLERARRAESSQWLFVGGIAPHKAQHRLVQALAVYRSVYDPAARLSLVGRAVSPGYAAAVRALVAALGLDDAVDMPGSVSHEQLVAYYRAADVFVSLSAHEGFCVPLLEAMHHKVPVVARSAGAVPETLGTGGLLLDDPAPQHVAATVHAVLADVATRAVLVQAGQARLAHFALTRTRSTMSAVVRRWVAADGTWTSPDADAAVDAASPAVSPAAVPT